MVNNHSSTRILESALLGMLACVAAPSQAGTVTVYTDRAQWELAAAAITPFFIAENFEDEEPGLLAPGSNQFYNDPFGFLIVDIVGDPGVNSIEDGSINPDIAAELSPNGSIYFLGQVAPGTEPRFLFQPFAAPPIANGFGADWVLGGSGLQMQMQVLDTIISFSDFLPAGEGFLGVITGERINTASPVVFLSATDGQLFGMDDLSYVGIPIPAAQPLMLTALIALRLLRRRRPVAASHEQAVIAR